MCFSLGKAQKDHSWILCLIGAQPLKNTGTHCPIFKSYKSGHGMDMKGHESYLYIDYNMINILISNFCKFNYKYWQSQRKRES